LLVENEVETSELSPSATESMGQRPASKGLTQGQASACHCLTRGANGQPSTATSELYCSLCAEVLALGQDRATPFVLHPQCRPLAGKYTVQVQAVPLMVLTKSKLAARPCGGHAVSCTLASTCKTCVCSAYNFVLTIESLFSGDSLKVEGKAKQELIGTMHTDNQSVCMVPISSCLAFPRKSLEKL
jgi:hypothetical protein